MQQPSFGCVKSAKLKPPLPLPFAPLLCLSLSKAPRASLRPRLSPRCAFYNYGAGSSPHLEHKKDIKDMSSDTAKENASVVDSSVTEWKQDMENLDDQGLHWWSGVEILGPNLNLGILYEVIGCPHHVRLRTSQYSKEGANVFDSMVYYCCLMIKCHIVNPMMVVLIFQSRPSNFLVKLALFPYNVTKHGHSPPEAGVCPSCMLMFHGSLGWEQGLGTPLMGIGFAKVDVSTPSLEGTCKRDGPLIICNNILFVPKIVGKAVVLNMDSFTSWVFYSFGLTVTNGNMEKIVKSVFLLVNFVTGNWRARAIKEMRMPILLGQKYKDTIVVGWEVQLTTNSSKVILIFSVNMSGFFQGYAQMMSSVGWRRDNVWRQGSGGKNPWGRSFKVKWLQLHDLPFQETLHLKNPLNDYKPVKISRDCQELPQDIGDALCELLDGKDGTDANLNRDDLPSKRPCAEPPYAMRHEECDMPAVHMTWDQTHTLYPSLLYQHQAETSRFHLAHLPITSGATKAPGMKHSQINGSLNSVQLDRNNSSRLDAWGWSAERSPLASSLTEDDILEMDDVSQAILHVFKDKILQFNVF
ncbi:YTH family protein [Actinidia rufa]|uniref:YTH domain-containing family protein n=1 Tax=Actinidia rufa TaxID=165716 RepID=A0A7J0G7Z3_9ERIC|nr:YTH family protein [Actinidia rufa]